MKMQRRQWMLLWMALAWALGGAVGLAAEEGSGQSYFVWSFEDDVKPELMESYMEAKIVDAKLCAQHKFEFPFLTFVSDFHVSTCGIFGRFAQIDDLPQKMEAFSKKTGGRAEQNSRQIAKCVAKCSSSIAAFRPDLSYRPENPAFELDFSKPFYQMAIFYRVKQDKYEQAEVIAKKIKALNEEKKSPMGYLVYECICGPDVPTFIALVQAKDKAAFAQLDKKSQENPDPEFERLFAEGATVLTKIETMEGTFVPEASYVPEGTFGDAKGDAR